MPRSMVQRIVFSFLFYTRAFSSPLSELISQGRFTLHQIVAEVPAGSSQRTDPIRQTYLKYGIPPPDQLEYNERVADDAPRFSSQSSTLAIPSSNDHQYLIKVQVGNRNLSLDLDTGSSDLWVVSTLLPDDMRKNRLNARLYDPKTANAKEMQGSTWRVVYGDRSSASGQVYVDKVTIGALTVPDQAVQVAANISTAFLHDGSKDGFVGLGFSRGNTVRPSKQPTWFDNVKPKLAKPLFATSLKRKAAGSYDFGYLDQSKYTGNIFYTNLTGKTSHWDFMVSGVSFGKSENQTRFMAIVDTGTSLWYMPAGIVDAYWKSVEGATYSDSTNRWVFPCSANLSNISVMIANGRVTVPGINMNFARAGANSCMGGLQRDLPMGFSIFGDVFMKGLYIVHEAPTGGQARLGFAQGR